MNGKAAVFMAIGLTLGLLAGLAIGAFMGEDRAPGPTPGTEFVGDAQKDDITEPLKPPPKDNSSPGEPSGSSLADLIAAVDVPPVPAGDGVVSGRVFTTTGEALPGVEITARPQYPDSVYTPAGDLEQRVRDRIRYERWRDLSDKVAISDADGEYELNGLDPLETYTLWAVLDGWRLNADSQTNRVQAGDTRKYTATRVFKLTVRVLKPDGTHAKPAWVDFAPTTRGLSHSQHYLGTGTKNIEVELGEWTVSAKAGDNYEYKSEEVVLKLTPDAEPQPLDIQVRGSPGVLGLVGFPDVLTGAYAVVHLIKDPSDTAPAGLEEVRKRRSSEDRVHVQERKGADGTQGAFSFRDLQPGTYRLVLEHEGHISAWQDVTILEDLVEVEFKVPEPDRNEYFVVRVFSPLGEPLPDTVANLKLCHTHGWQTAGGKRSREGEAVWVKRAEPSSRRETITDWWYELTVVHKDYGEITRRVERNSPSDQDFRLTAPGALTLTVTGYNEHELIDSLLWSVVEPGKPGDKLHGFELRDRKRNGKADSNRSPLTIGPLQPGAYDVVLMLMEDHAGRELARHQVTIAAGQNTFNASMPALHKLTIRCQDSVEVRSMSLYRDGKRLGSRVETEEPRVVEFRNLVSGEYELRSSTGTMRVTLPVGGVVEFAPRRFDCIILSDIAKGGVVEGLGLCNGDKLIEVDGTPLENIEMFHAQVMLSLSQESTTWKVLRNGVPTEITFNGKTLMETLRNKRETNEDLEFDPGFQTE